jgi:peroxiredoxin
MSKRTPDLIALFVTVVLGAPALFFLAAATAEGESKRRETPLRAMLGDEAYETIARGGTPEQGYFGNDRIAPDFTLRDKDGNAWKLSDHRGKVVVLNFWSVTCPPCVEEMPSLIELAQRFDPRSDVELVSVTTDADWATVGPLFQRDSKLRVLFDADRRVTAGLFGTRQLPETWIIDPEGVIRVRVDGARDWSHSFARELILSYR